jgi:hypothetical protein
MSNIPYTSLVVNPDGLETLGGRTPDVIYMMAPALKGGEKLDDDGVPVIDINGNTVFRDKIFSTRESFEREFGRARDGSQASIYAKWIYDKGKYAIRCRRVASSDLAYATAALKNEAGDDILQVKSRAQSTFANEIFVDVDGSTNREAYLVKPNAAFDPALMVLETNEVYSAVDRLFFEGKRLSDNLPFRIEFYGDGSTQNFELFNWSPVSGSAPFIVTDGQTTFDYAGPDMAVIDIPAGQYSYDTATKELRFGSAPVLGSHNLLVNTLCPFGEARLTMSSNGTAQVYNIDFAINDVDFLALYVNGIGAQYDQKYLKLVRLYTTSQFVSMRGLTVTVGAGTNVDTIKLTIVAGTGVSMKAEVYDNLATLADVVNQVNVSSSLVLAEILVNNMNQLPAMCTEVAFLPIGIMLTIRNGNEVEKFDDLRDAEDISMKLNDGANGSDLVTMEVIGSANHELPSLESDVQLSGGRSGDNPTIIDYLDALAEAAAVKDVTIMIAPGVEDEAFHALMKDECEASSSIGDYRIAFAGVGLGESLERKQQRTRILNSERLSMIGDGLYLVSAYDGRRRLYSGAVGVCPFVAQIISQKFFVCHTYKYLSNAYGVEHEYDDAQHQVLHDARLITFRINNGIQIIDAITTSTIMAYEDIHMVRTYDVVSRGIRKAMEKAIGKSNMPPTWGWVLGMIQKFLESLRNIGAIMDFRLLNEVSIQDIVEKRFRFRVGLIPVFPIKYVEAELDIIPPTYVPTS